MHVNRLGLGALRGMIAALIVTLIVITIYTFLIALDGAWYIGLSNLLFELVAYFILLMSSIVVGSLLGLFIGISMLFFNRGTKGWLAALIGGSMPFICSFLFDIPQNAYSDLFAGRWSNICFLVVGCITFAIVGWQVNNEIRANAPPLPQKVEINNEEIVGYILRGQRIWKSNRYEIDRELLEKGYSPTKIEEAWSDIANGAVWLDAANRLRVDKPTRLRASAFSLWSFFPRLTGSYTIWYFLSLHLLSLFFTPLIFLPAIILTLVFLIVYKHVPAVNKAASKIRI